MRRARIVCICPTYRRAWDTVMPSYFKVFPQSMGEFRGSRGDPADHIFDKKIIMGGQEMVCHVEVLFRAVNDLDIEDFFRGFEFTAVWLPEADTNKDLQAILSLASNRAGRYPEPDDRPVGLGNAYTGIFGDANAPMIETYFFDRFYQKKGSKPDDDFKQDRLFIQPSGFSDNAENMDNLKKIRSDFYQFQASLLDPYDVQRLLANKPGYGRHGQPVHPNFDPELHVAQRSLEVEKFSPVYIGIDAGSNALIPGATFSQRSYSGQWRTLAEIYLPEGQMNTAELGADIRRVLNTRFGAVADKVGGMLCLDPAAGGRNASSEYTTAMELQHYTGIEAQLAPTNDPRMRRSAIDKLFKNNIAPKEPRKIIDPECRGLIGGYAGGFHYARRGTLVSATPVKNRFSHVVEADEYAPLTVDGMDASEGRFIRPAFEGATDTVAAVFAD